MNGYIENTFLAPTTGKKSTLATFTSRPSSTREGKKRENELTIIATNAMELLQKNGITAQTSPYPLAISDLDGNIHSSGKSKFLNTLIKSLDFQSAISSIFPSHLCTVIDMLTVGKYAIQKGSTHVYLVIDKPDYLPPPRSIVHTSRGKRNQEDSLDPVIRDDATIPHSNSYSAVLANSTSFWRCLLHAVPDRA